MTSDEQVLINLWRADFSVIAVDLPYGAVRVPVESDTEGSEPACRCYRCGALLLLSEVRVSRWVGGIRPACIGCEMRERGARIRQQAMRDHEFVGDGKYCEAWIRGQGSGAVSMSAQCGYPADMHPGGGSEPPPPDVSIPVA